MRRSTARTWLTARTWFTPLALAAVVAWAAPAWAQDDGGSVYVRIHYAPYFVGELEKSPADPQGQYESEMVDQADKLELELVFLRHLGISASRIRFAREFENGAQQKVNESASALMLNATLYGSPVRHNAWNMLLGIGYGTIGEYRIKVDAVRQDESPLHRNLTVRRIFAGIEFTFDRLGIRYELNQIEAEKSSGSKKTELSGVFQFVTFFIPLN